MDPSTDTPHCDVTDAQAIKVRANGTFSAHFRVETGIIGDGYCATRATHRVSSAWGTSRARAPS